MRILLWAPFGAGAHYWGPGTSAFRLYKSLKDKNIKITLIHASEEQKLFPEIYHEQVKLPTLKKKGIINKIVYTIYAKLWIVKNYNKYDVVHGISAFEYTFMPLLQFSKLGKPVFIKITGEHGGFGHNSKLSKLFGIAKRRKLNANNITGYISISDAIKSNLLFHGVREELIHSIPNGVDINRFNQIDERSKSVLREELSISNVITFIYLGGLTYNKRVIEMVKAVSILNSEGYADFQLLIVGPDRSGGKVNQELTEIINTFNLHKLITQIDKVDNPELFLKASDIFLLVSEKEGMSNSLLEAMSTGLATIVTDISGSSDLVKDHFNGLYTDGTPKDIANKMCFFLNNQHKINEFGEKNRQLIVNEYSSDVILQKHIELFKSTINNG